MPRCLPGAALVVAAVLAATSPAFARDADRPYRPVELKDDRGATVTLRARPLRIVALSPHLVEIVHAAGAGGQLAGAVRYSDFPEEALGLPQVGDASRLDMERVLALEPDLVLGWRSGNAAADLQRLERLGLRVFVTEPGRLSDIPRLIRVVGDLAGTHETASRAAAALEDELARLRKRYGSRAPVRVFYEIWHRPLLTVNGSHLISDVLRLCGGRNVFAESPVLTPAVSLEAVLAAAPEVVLGGSSGAAPEALSSRWRDLPVAALRTIPVRFVPPDLIQRQTPRIVQGAAAICEHLQEVRKGSSDKR